MILTHFEKEQSFVFSREKAVSQTKKTKNKKSNMCFTCVAKNKHITLHYTPGGR